MVHRPKTELFDIDAMTNTDPKQVVRAVDTYRVEPFGLYLARPTPGREQFHYLESWLLPGLDLRITDFHANPGHEVRDFYLDVVRIETGPVWRTTDLYLDLALDDGERPEVLDTDELLAAVLAGHLTAELAGRALDVAFDTVHGLARCDYRLSRWLRAAGVTVSWGGRAPAGR